MAIQDFSGNDPSYGMGAGSQIAQFLASLPGIAQKQSQQQSQDTQDQSKLYFDLRQQGYSQEDAADRVNRSYRSTNFMQNLLGGQSNVFQPGTETDQIDAERAKAKSEAAAKLQDQETKKAEAQKFLAQATYYQNGGAAQKYNHNDNLTPNQIQGRIKELRGQVGMGTPEEDQSINDEISYMNNLFNKKSGFKGTDTSAAPATSGKYKAGQTVYYKGKPVVIKKINDDGTYEI